jgi:hypothetical protein
VCFVEPLKLMGSKKSGASSAAASANSSASAVTAGAASGTAGTAGTAGAASPAKVAAVSDVSVQEGSAGDSVAVASTLVEEGGSAKALRLKNPDEQAPAGDRQRSGDKVWDAL